MPPKQLGCRVKKEGQQSNRWLGHLEGQLERVMPALEILQRISRDCVNQQCADAPYRPSHWRRPIDDRRDFLFRAFGVVLRHPQSCGNDADVSRVANSLTKLSEALLNLLRFARGQPSIQHKGATTRRYGVLRNDRL